MSRRRRRSSAPSSSGTTGRRRRRKRWTLPKISRRTWIGLGVGLLALGAVLVTLFVLTDLIDGAMARARGHGTPFGAVLDSTCDRIVDGALFAGL
ncbi:MAG: hypothetical protein CL477_10350, partial [Acidobacteria bacterium]|nr:hypothetical protein [Acidobacteriota bacterium]